MKPTQAQIEALIKALEPFAKIEIPPGASDGMWVAKTLYCNNQITAFQVRQARAACNAKIAFDAAAEAGEPQHSVDFLEGVAEGKAAMKERCARLMEVRGRNDLAAAIMALKDQP